MKTTSRFSALCLATCALAFSMPAATQAGNTKKPAASHTGDFQKPVKGMSKARVREIYGKPDEIMQTGDGEMWTYSKGNLKRLIPFYFGTPSVMNVFFNESGHVISYTISQD
jgi:hypothetical protein